MSFGEFSTTARESEQIIMPVPDSPERALDTGGPLHL